MENKRVSLKLCADVSAADWIVSQGLPWRRLVARGPAGYPRYARLRFIPDPTREGQKETDVQVGDDALTESNQLSIVLGHLARFTEAPDDCYFCLWDGWGRVGEIETARVNLPTREYLLFNGSIADFGDWGNFVQNKVSSPNSPPPAFMWPADHAWCVASDIDPHYAGIGATAEAIECLIKDVRIDVIFDNPEDEPPHYL